MSIADQGFVLAFHRLGFHGTVRSASVATAVHSAVTPTSHSSSAEHACNLDADSFQLWRGV